MWISTTAKYLWRENAKAGEKIQLDLQSYTGTLHSEFRLLADLEEHDKKIEEIYYDLIVPMQGLNRAWTRIIKRVWI